MEQLPHEQLDALGRMSKEIHDEYRNLGFAGISVNPVRYLAFRQQTQNHSHLKLVVSDAGVFFMDAARKIKFKFDPSYFLIYQEGLHYVEEEKIKNSENPVIVLENLLEFWKRHGTGICLVADHMNGCQYLIPEHQAELDRINRLYSKEGFTINPMLHKKAAPTKFGPGVLDLED